MTLPGDPPNDGEGRWRRISPAAKDDALYEGSERQSSRSSSRAIGEAPYEAVLGQMVTIREGGVERRVTAAEAFLLQLAKRGLEGDSAAARASLAVIEEAMNRQGAIGPLHIVWKGVAPGSVTSALRRCEWPETRSLPRDRTDGPRTVARRGRVGASPQTLNPADQRTIVKATRTPHKVRWPEWWSETRRMARTHHGGTPQCEGLQARDIFDICWCARHLSLSQTLSCLAVDRESDDDRAQ